MTTRRGGRRPARANQAATTPAPNFTELMARTRNAGEQDFRLAILNALLRTPHRAVAPHMPLFEHVHERDPRFFGPLAAWYFKNGSVHDLKQLFAAYMATSKFSDDYRNAGIAMITELPPYQVERVIGLIKGHEEGGKFIPGVAGSVPRSVRTAIEDYLHQREKNHEQFDNVVLHARSSLKTLYASLRIKPGEYAQRVLFDNDPPEGSRLFVLKQLAKTNNSGEQARLIVQNKIPYRVAVSAIKQVTPALLVALVDAMTPQEVINNLASLKKRGAMDNKDLRRMIEAKLKEAEGDKRVSALKTRQALQAADIDAEMAQKVEKVGDKQIKSKAKIKRPTAIFVDKSGSMQQAIEIGKQLCAIVAPICQANLYVYAFDTLAYAIEAKGNELSDWEKAFKGIKADGGTSCGVALDMMRRKKQLVEQVIVITDQGENGKPYLADAMLQYQQELGTLPTVMILNCGQFSNHLEVALTRNNIEVDTYTFSGDYYSLPSLLPMLAGGTRLELLMDILAYPLPVRKDRQLAGAPG